jgi:hypothetical protein
MICVDGSVKLLDFGLARLTRGETLKIDSFFGKLAYMSPEQIDRRQIDRRADVFALGALMHELLSGRPLFRGVDDAETVRRVQNLVIQPPSVLNPSVPVALDMIVMRALKHDPDQRYSSAAEMLAALEELGASAASQEGLLKYMGSIAPDVFSYACEECGSQLPCGVECPKCRTQVDAVGSAWAAVAGVPMPTVRSDGDVASPTPLPAEWQLLRPSLGARLRHVRLTLYVLWGYLLNWADARTARLRALRLGVGAAVEQAGVLWACAWPRAARAPAMSARDSVAGAASARRR